MKALTTEEFKENFYKKYGKFYILDKVNYVNNKTEITVTCPIHGDFKKRPDLLMDGCKCPKCSKTAKTPEEIFIQKANFVHNGYFKYVSNTFTNVSSVVGVVCPHHGIWFPRANNHLNGANCPQCSKEGITHKISKLPKKNKSTKKYNTQTFKEKIYSLYGDKYDLSKVNYIDNKTPIRVICKKHGDFMITPNHLLLGRGCSKCSNNYHYSTKEAIQEFRKKHKKYIYTKTVYNSTHSNIIVTCPIHGDFVTTPANHLKGQGCPKCNNSKLENEIRELLDSVKITYDFRTRKLPFLNGLELDFYLPKLKAAIECQGIQHFQAVSIFGGETAYAKTLLNDSKKRKLCEDNGIKLFYYSNLKIVYPYNVYEDNSQLLNDILNLNA